MLARCSVHKEMSLDFCSYDATSETVLNKHTYFLRYIGTMKILSAVHLASLSIIYG